MLSVGIRVLKEKTSAVLQRVRDHGEEVEITYRGEVIARIVPVRKPQAQAAARARDSVLWADWDQLTAEITAAWQGSTSAVEAIDEGRRAL